METLLGYILSYLIGLAAGISNDAISERRRKNLMAKIGKNPSVLRSIQDRKSLIDQMRLVGVEVAHLKTNNSQIEQHLVYLLTDDVFQNDVVRWLTSWIPEEKKKAEYVMSGKIEKALVIGGAGDREVEQFRTGYFDYIEKVVFSDPVLSNWRLSLALNTAFERLDELEGTIRVEETETRIKIEEQHAETRQRVEDIVAQSAYFQVKQFTKEQRSQALKRYQDLLLEFCDIIDLANLGEIDRHIASRKLELRRLYVPLHIQIEVAAGNESNLYDLGNIRNRGDKDNVKNFKNLKFFNVAGNLNKHRISIGERLAKSGRLVLLGDPGAGKTTLIRWIATAYLLRLQQSQAFKDLPDIKTLPDQDWLPIVIRCRDLDKSSKTGIIEDILCETFRKVQISEYESHILTAVMWELLAEGEAILLVDGLDEINNIIDRTRFCKQIERFQVAFPKAPIIVTSRTVGYREMRCRIGRGFEHATVSEFSKEDKDEFIRRWCDTTELPERRDRVANDLIKAIHSSDRIERLTGNPMLLTTIALVKRKSGKLLNRRIELYSSAVDVLLRWRQEVYEPVDDKEAMPQLEYLAYEMCSRGTQQIRHDEIIELLEKMRMEFPNIRAIRHDPTEFLRLLEQRTGIIIETGDVYHKGRLTPVFEFRHLTFQEYLAARALVEGRLPRKKHKKKLAEIIATLAGQISEFEGDFVRETVVKDNWREVIRLCVSCLGDDFVDDAMKAILTPLKSEDPEKTVRPRSVLAALCLADEPNVSDGVAHKVIRAFVRQIKKGDGSGSIETTVDSAAIELVGTDWEKKLRLYLVNKFYKRDSKNRECYGGLLGIMGRASAPDDDLEFHKWLENQVSKIESEDHLANIDAATAISCLAYKGRSVFIPQMVSGLLAMLRKGDPSAHAGAWVLGGLAVKNAWVPTKKEIEQIISFVSNPISDDGAAYWSILVLCKIADKERVSKVFMNKLNDSSIEIRKASLGVLSIFQENETDQKLLSEYVNGSSPWIDPKSPINEKRVEKVAKRLKLPLNEVRGRYEKLADKYRLQLT